MELFYALQETVLDALNFLSKYDVMLMSGAKTTLFLSVAAGICSIVIGTLLSFLKLSKIKPLRWFANVWVSFVHGTPVLVQISLVFYGFPLLGFDMPEMVLFGFDFERLFSGVLALTINTSAYICEIVRSGIQSIDKGQMEAARSIGFGPIESMYRIILPPAIKNMLPNFGNEFANLIKNSSQASVIGIGELMFVADTMRGISFRPFLPLILVAIVYFIMTSIVSAGVHRLEKNMQKSDR